MTTKPSSSSSAAYARIAGAWPVTIEASRFRGVSGVEEIHLTARPTLSAAFETQLDWLVQAYRAALDELGLAPTSAVFRRVFCSDIVNQAAALAESPLGTSADDELAAASQIGQSPAGPARLALWAYHLNDPLAALDKRSADGAFVLDRGPLTHRWTCGLACSAAATATQQTADAFARYEMQLAADGLTLADHVVRTWLFVRDIDADYAAVAEARRALFAERGLTADTHYIASTGIEGRSADGAARLTLDAYAIGGLRPEQTCYVKAPDYLSPTDRYGVTFERATSIRYADRTHVWLSGTASIDADGQTVHQGDAALQTQRTLTNIDALLRAAGARSDDLSVLIAYLRDPCDEEVVRAAIRQRYGAVPLVAVMGAVCRPGWLVEVEGQAAFPADRPMLPAY